MFQKYSGLAVFLVLAAACDGGGGGGGGGTDAPGGSADAPAAVQFAGEWGRGGWLSSGGQFGTSSSMTTTLTGTTVGGQTRIDGTAPSVLTGTFDGAKLLGMFRSTNNHMLDLRLTGGFLVGPYTGSVDAIATFVSDAAPPAPATAPAKLTGTWTSSKSAATGSFTLTVTGGDLTMAHITATGLVDEAAFLGYNDRVLQGAAQISGLQVVLFGSGTRFVGSYGLPNTNDNGVLELSVAP